MVIETSRHSRFDVLQKSKEILLAISLLQE